MIEFIFFNIELHDLFAYLGDNSLSFASFANILSYSEGDFFCLVYYFLCCAKAFQFNMALFVYFAFIFDPLGGGSKKFSLLFLSETILPMFSTKRLMVSGITFRSLIHF